jgi:hypothetical protein
MSKKCGIVIPAGRIFAHNPQAELVLKSEVSAQILDPIPRR